MSSADRKFARQKAKEAVKGEKDMFRKFMQAGAAAEGMVKRAVCAMPFSLRVWVAILIVVKQWK